MSPQRVLLIKPAYAGSYYQHADLPAGLGYISQALDDAGIENAVWDMQLEPGRDALFAKVRDFRPDLIGLSLMSYRFLSHYELIRALKAEFPQVPIVAGGPHISTYREQVLRRCPQLDYGVTLEGEETIVALCRGDQQPHEIRGLIYRDNGEPRYAGDRPFIADLDRLGFPKYARFDLKRYEFVTVITSRGCPYRCIYCPVLYTIGKDWRWRGAASVVDELGYWHRRGLRRFEFGDDNFTLRRERVAEICDLIEKRSLTGLAIGLGNGIRADRVDKPLLEHMRRAGFSYVAFGVEAGNNKVLKALRKGETIDKIEAGIRAACEVGFPVHLFFLLGSPTETEADVKDSVNLALKYPVEDVRFYNILPFPRSELYETLQREGRFIQDPETHLNDSSHWLFSPVFETPELSRQDRLRLLEWANRVTKEHTDRVCAERKIARLCARGIPRLLARALVAAGANAALRRLLPLAGLRAWLKRLLGLAPAP